MPIFMDRHDVSETVTAENVAQLHQEDLKIQHKFNCRGLTYWFDKERSTAFCLVEAPNKQALIDMHDKAHGEIPHRIIEVDASIVESFLGRIEDPEKSQNTELNIINDPAFRTIMVIRLKNISFKKPNSKFQEDYKSILTTAKQFEGNTVKQEEDYFLISFKSVSKAVLCALEIDSKFGKNDFIKLKIGLSAGVPVTEKDAIFEETIKLAERMCANIQARVAVSSEVKDLYKSENQNTFFDENLIKALSQSDEKFLNQLMDFTENKWRNPDLKVDDFNMSLGCSKSQLYRKMIALTGKSPNIFIRDFRLNEAMKLLNKQADNISEIAFETGFSSPSYFSKCFFNKYGILPSDYLRTR